MHCIRHPAADDSVAFDALRGTEIVVCVCACVRVYAGVCPPCLPRPSANGALRKATEEQYISIHKRMQAVPWLQPPTFWDRQKHTDIERANPAKLLCHWRTIAYSELQREAEKFGTQQPSTVKTWLWQAYGMWRGALRRDTAGPEKYSWGSQPSALAEKSANIGHSQIFHFSSGPVRLAKFIKGT